MLNTPLIPPIRISWVTILGQVQVWPGLDGLARFGWSLPPDETIFLTFIVLLYELKTGCSNWYGVTTFRTIFLQCCTNCVVMYNLVKSCTNLLEHYTIYGLGNGAGTPRPAQRALHSSGDWREAQ